ncbi:hypothetical protein [Nocardia farcinica]|uniref:hypothetical protein n=1 Tax=Nocardia farcinica TaxID=37329 RepID=UPI001894F911|nr:hypothetical protein [Nocardia farcinica]MBF6284485.1 hypothetical protein [Nocardia farcinica]
MAPLDTASDREPDTYPWKAAPAHLKTRRQLRAAGLAPGGHAPVAQTETTRFGRRQITYLYDSRLAVPKRTASPKQLLAVAKAIREHQARAAERHGVDRADLDRVHDPAPGWDHTPESTTHKEENTMSDSSAADREPDASALQLGTPTGHGQRIAHLLATVAVNQARQRLDKLDAAVDQAECQGPDAVAQLEDRMAASIDNAEARLTANTAQHGPASVAPLADALVFRTGSDLAADRLAQLTSDYAADWGVRIDAEELTVGIDPDFDPVAAQTFAEAEALFDRKSAAVDIVSALPLADATKAAVGEAISAWHDGIDPNSLHAYLDGEPTRRQQLGADLAAAKISEADRARVGFVVDFLRGDVSDIDLLASPVFVDPGEETRGRIPRLLEEFARNPRIAPQVGREISVMTAADQERVRAAGKAIAAGDQVDTKLWPGYVDRQTLAGDLHDYARDVQEMRLDADELAEGRFSAEERARLGHKSPTLQDETSARIDRLVATREKLLDTARNGKGLASIERAQLAAVIADIDTGRTELPELLFADEHTKADTDFLRRERAAAQLAAVAREAITQRIDATKAVDPRTRAAGQLTEAVKDVGYTLSTVASGTRAFSLEAKRTAFVEKRGRLGQALAQAGVPTTARAEIRDLLDTHARKAGDLGAASLARTEQWEAKTAQVAATRDDAIAQREAAAAGRAKPPETARQPQGPQRACTARIDASLAAGHAVAPAGIRQLHMQEQEIGR